MSDNSAVYWLLLDEIREWFYDWEEFRNNFTRQVPLEEDDFLQIIKDKYNIELWEK